MSFSIYLAGPEVFLPEFGRAQFEAKKRLCRELGFEGVAPTDGDVEETCGTPFERGLTIYRGNIAQMRAADAIVANMTPFRGVSMDAGTAFEIGFLAALGKPVLGYSNVSANFETRSAGYYARGCHAGLDAYSAGTAIERFDMADNLMMAGAVADAGFTVHAMAVAAGEELTSMAGFTACLADLARRMRG